MKIQILGPGCSTCRLLERKVQEAARELGLDFELEKVEDLDSILAFGVMMTPALVVDGEVKLVGRVPHRSQIKALLAPES